MLQTPVDTQIHDPHAPAGGLTTPSHAVLRPDRQPPDPRRPFAHQREARARLTAHLGESHLTGVFEGCLVIATGGGKNYTTIGWLMAEVINRGRRVVWLAHHEALLEQAAREFHRAAGRADRRDRVSVRIVAGGHCPACAIEPTDDVVIASVAMLARHPEILVALLNDPQIFVVVDEAHHSVADTYRTILDPLRARKPRSLLGLTGTLTRTRPGERPVLGDLFGNRVLFQADAADLIEHGILARPTLIRVRTHARVDRGLAPAELGRLAKGSDFSPAWLNRIARLERRNRVILDDLLKHQKRYGKTLVYAIDIAQAHELARRLRAAGVAADYIASARDPGDNRSILGRFREPDGLAVVVNVLLLTEEIDLPMVQTVLLARPTTSAILLHQMMGRALRGPAVGGTEMAYLVMLEDDWRRLPRALDPARHLAFVAERAIAPFAGRGARQPAGPSSYEDIAGLADQIRALIPAPVTDSEEALAERWDVLGGAGAGESPLAVVAVYSHQRRAWDDAITVLEALPVEALATLDVATLSTRCFASCLTPLPSTRALERLLDHFRRGGGRPRTFDLEARLACDPRTLARLIVADDLGERARTALENQRYSELAQALYTTGRDFRAAVDDAVYSIQHPEGMAWAQPVQPVFESVEKTRAHGSATVPGPSELRSARAETGDHRVARTSENLGYQSFERS